MIPDTTQKAWVDRRQDHAGDGVFVMLGLLLANGTSFQARGCS